jgi:hypothetical protein
MVEKSFCKYFSTGLSVSEDAEIETRARILIPLIEVKAS